MDWPFDQSPNVAAITTVGVLENKLPILVVQHYADDHSWSFLCGTTDNPDDGRVVGMRTALELDPTLASIADLPVGWIARRDAVGSDWVKEQEYTLHLTMSLHGDVTYRELSANVRGDRDAGLQQRSHASLD